MSTFLNFFQSLWLVTVLCLRPCTLFLVFSEKSQDRLSSVLKWTWLAPAFSSNLISTAFIDPFSCFWKHTDLFLVWSLLTIHFTLSACFSHWLSPSQLSFLSWSIPERPTLIALSMIFIYLLIHSFLLISLKRFLKFISYYLSLPVDSKIYKYEDCASDLPFYPHRFALSQAYGKL